MVSRSGCLASLRSIGLRCWRLFAKTQIKRHGRYSGDNLVEFNEYHKRVTWMRVMSVCLLTPVPVVVIILLMDCIPLAPPEQGPNPIGLWLRVFIAVAIDVPCMTYQCQFHVTWLRPSIRFLILLGIVSGVSSAVFCWLVALVVGLPVPFMVLLATVPVIISIMVGVIWSHNEKIRNTPQAFQKMLPYIYMLCCQVSMTVIYPLYNHVFVGLSTTGQTAFVLVLPIIKTSCKMWINQLFQDTDDTKPESIIFNVEVFHALFVSYCMQSSTSIYTALVLVLMDLFLIWISMLDISKLVIELRRLNNTAPPPASEIRSTRTLMEVTLELVCSDPGRCVSRGPTQRIATAKSIVPGFATLVSAGQVLPQAESKGCPTDFLDERLAHQGRLDNNSLFVGKFLQLIYITEFIVLIEYTELIMPIISGVLVAVLSHSPNHIYYQFLEGVTTANVASRLANTSIYTLSEAFSLFLIAILIWWKLGYSLLHQLAFVLETRQTRVQTKLILWVIYIIQNSLVHCGADYSFKFKWLHQRNDV